MDLAERLFRRALAIRMPVHVAIQTVVRQSIREVDLGPAVLEAQHGRLSVVDVSGGLPLRRLLPAVWVVVWAALGEEEDVLAAEALVHPFDHVKLGDAARQRQSEAEAVSERDAGVFGAEDAEEALWLGLDVVGARQLKNEGDGLCGG